MPLFQMRNVRTHSCSTSITSCFKFSLLLLGKQIFLRFVSISPLTCSFVYFQKLMALFLLFALLFASCSQGTFAISANIAANIRLRIQPETSRVETQRGFGVVLSCGCEYISSGDSLPTPDLEQRSRNNLEDEGNGGLQNSADAASSETPDRTHLQRRRRSLDLDSTPTAADIERLCNMTVWWNTVPIDELRSVPRPPLPGRPLTPDEL